MKAIAVVVTPYFIGKYHCIKKRVDKNFNFVALRKLLIPETPGDMFVRVVLAILFDYFFNDISDTCIVKMSGSALQPLSKYNHIIFV